MKKSRTFPELTPAPPAPDVAKVMAALAEVEVERKRADGLLDLLKRSEAVGAQDRLTIGSLQAELARLRVLARTALPSLRLSEPFDEPMPAPGEEWTLVRGDFGRDYGTIPA